MLNTKCNALNVSLKNLTIEDIPQHKKVVALMKRTLKIQKCISWQNFYKKLNPHTKITGKKNFKKSQILGF